MLYIIGLGLNEKSLSLEGLEAIKKCKNVYLETYTVEFPYRKPELEKIISKKITELKREEVESNRLVNEAGEQDIALLVYGSPLFATTHISLILEAKKEKVKTKIIFNASVFDAIAETGLQLYKFGKITSIPKQNADFLKLVLENKKINAHSLILADIGMGCKEALERIEKELEKKSVKIGKIIACSKLGTKDSEIYYDLIEKLKNKKARAPFCFIIPGELHFLEKEALESLQKSEKI